MWLQYCDCDIVEKPVKPLELCMRLLVLKTLAKVKSNVGLKANGTSMEIVSRRQAWTYWVVIFTYCNLIRYGQCFSNINNKQWKIFIAIIFWNYGESHKIWNMLEIWVFEPLKWMQISANCLGGNGCGSMSGRYLVFEIRRLINLDCGRLWRSILTENLTGGKML